METLQETITRQFKTINRAIKLDIGHLEHSRDHRLMDLYSRRLKETLRTKQFYLQNYSDLL